ncbi:ribonuclease R [Bdellovibrio sp. NC01]|uniref:ribonuclease R n=1 Tax=Bdellovibrio sp. NC01 TaxID=2220073 RepID=UPI00115B02B4|nr:ribonuclease R [Bdellovibrio sp. NC01]QDK36496.1 ribonuclease R [Bdellovibrio sp. NC01]
MQKKQILPGTIKRHPDGFGFFIADDKDQPDVYIPRNSMEGIMTNDKVMVEVYPEKGGERFRGEIVKIISRGTKTFVGRFFKLNDKFGILRDEGKGWGQDLKIKIEDSMGAKDKELVAAEAISYPEDGKGFTGKVTAVIGDALDPLTDIKRVILSSNIPQEFSKETLEEATHYKEVPEEKDFKGRKDLRHLDLITIDGATAKDFDDAVYVETNNEGFLLYVAIADVSHYVQVGSAIDRDAYERGTSVYFPNFVVPMLPEVLSNGLCSLNPHVPRLCVVAEMQFDFTGEMTGSDFYEAVMESKSRVTYGEAQEVIDGNKVEKHEHVREGILRLADLAKILMAKRFKDGSLDLEIPETELVIDGAGVPIDIQRSERLFSHRLIEEMMLAANVAVAKFLHSRDVPALYRIHEPPNEQAIHILEKYLMTFGGKTKLNQGKLQKRLTKALEEFENRPEAQILNILALRSMSQAKYSPNNVGHFGLGFEFYAHFTSPIRRYPDLIIHRLLKNQVVKSNQYRLMSEDDLATAGTILSAAEQRSTKAERQVQSIKKARFMEKFIGQEFDGIISSVAKFGIFVLLREYDCDGLIRLDDLGNDKWEYDEENIRLVARRSGFSFNIGDAIRIQVAAADPELGQVSFVKAGLEKDEDDEMDELDERTDAQKSSEKYLNKLRKNSKNEKSRDERDYPRIHNKNGDRKDRGSDRRDRNARPDRNDRQEKVRGESGSRHEMGPRSERRGGKSGREETFSDRGVKPSRFAGKQGNKSKFFRDSREDESGQAEKVRKASQSFRPVDREDDARKGPDENLLRMILGPAEYRKSKGEDSADKPKLSKKLMFAEQSKLRDNNENSEKNSDSLKDRKSDRKNPKERRSSKNDSGGVRKARVSQGRGKGKTR